MKKSTYIFALVIVSIATIGIISATSNNKYDLYQTGNWVAPKSADNNKNPFANNSDATKKGKKLYNQNCAICHGNKGLGDGMAGISLNPKPSNLITNKVQVQSDGAIFWKLTEGNSPMPSYKSFSETQRWQLVNYIRELKNK